MQLKLVSIKYLNSLSHFIFIFICITAEKCLPTGLLDISECYYGFPIALSYPHFLETDPKLFDAVDGMSPNRSKHETYFYVQPVSHMVFELVFYFALFKKVRNPFHWMDHMFWYVLVTVSNYYYYY